MTKPRNYLFLVLFTFTIIFTSCGNNAGSDTTEMYDNLVELSITIIPPNDRSFPHEVHTLITNRAFAEMRNRMAAEGVRFRLESNYMGFFGSELDEHMAYFRTSLMAGTGPDLFMVYTHPLPALAQGGFLADINDLIRQDPSVNRSDFFENVLDAFEFDGRLIAMPLLFGAQMIGINNHLPETFIEQFAAKSHVTINEIAHMFDAIQTAHPEFAHLRPVDSMMANDVISIELSNYLSLVDRSLDLDIYSFANFLNNVSAILEFDSMALSSPFTWSQHFADLFAFSNKFLSMNMAQALLEVDESYFVHHVPLVTSSGELVLSSSSWGILGVNPSLFAIRAGGNETLAWEFLKQLIDVFATFEGSVSVGTGTMETSIKRTYFPQRETAILSSIFYEESPNRFWHMASDISVNFSAKGDEIREQAAVESAVLRLAEYYSKPMVIPPMIPHDFFSDTLDQFSRRIITAEAAAHQINNRLWLWLRE